MCSVPTDVILPERFNAAQFFLDRHLDEGRGARSAFRYRGRTITYAELAIRANRAGNALAARGVQCEQRVMLALPDGPEFAEVFWGALKIGAVAVPVNDRLRAEEYEFLLNDSRAPVIVVGEEGADAVLAARPRCPWLRSVIAVGRPRRATLPYERLLDRAAPDLAPADVSRDDVALWGYTSGSTGRPKAAVHLHHDLVHAAERVARGVFGVDPDDLLYSVSKLYFAYGLGNTLYFPALVGAASVLVPDRPDPARILETIHNERPTVLFTVPTVYARLLQVKDGPARFDVSSLRLCVSSGEPLPAALFHAWRERFGHDLHDVVGSTEALHDFIANHPGRARPGSSGQLIAGFEARLVDDHGQPVPEGAVGQLFIKGESTAPYYWNRHEQSKQTMIGEWLRTGDMFSRDGDGYFYFAGRADGMMKVGGLWVSPAEVEAALMEHPVMLEVAVVGRADAGGLLHPQAFCVLKAGVAPGALLEEELREWVHRRLPGHKVPRWIEFVADLPKTATGKVQRFALRTAPVTAHPEDDPRVVPEPGAAPTPPPSHGELP
jgi:benzoate-CoA ligase family protein